MLFETWKIPIQLYNILKNCVEIMASFGSKGSKTEPANSEPGSDDHFRQMRDRMNRERESFFQDSPSSFFGRESPFFRVSIFFVLLPPTSTFPIYPMISLG